MLATAKRAPKTRDAKGGTARSAVAVDPVGRWDSAEGSPKLADAGRVTGKSLARGVHRCEAARVTSERKRGSDAGGPPLIGAALGPIFPVTRE